MLLFSRCQRTEEDDVVVTDQYQSGGTRRDDTRPCVTASTQCELEIAGLIQRHQRRRCVCENN